MITKWYLECIEDPLKELVFLLRNNGFNTECSCAGHGKERAYIQMAWDDNDLPYQLTTFLLENKDAVLRAGFDCWEIEARWSWLNINDGIGSSYKSLDLKLFNFSEAYK